MDRGARAAGGDSHLEVDKLVAVAYYVDNNAVNLFAADTTRVSDKRVMDRMAQHIVDRNRKFHATPAATQPSTQPTTPNKPLDWRDPEYWHF